MVPDHVSVGCRDQGGQTAEEVEGFEEQPGGSQGMGPRTAQAVGDATVGEQGKAILGEGGPQTIAAQTLQGFSVPGRDGPVQHGARTRRRGRTRASPVVADPDLEG